MSLRPTCFCLKGLCWPGMVASETTLGSHAAGFCNPAAGAFSTLYYYVNRRHCRTWVLLGLCFALWLIIVAGFDFVDVFPPAPHPVLWCRSQEFRLLGRILHKYSLLQRKYIVCIQSSVRESFPSPASLAFYQLFLYSGALCLMFSLTTRVPNRFCICKFTGLPFEFRLL